MAITLNPGRQEVIAAKVDIDYTDVADGAAYPAVQLPAGAIVVGGFFVTTSAFDATTTLTLSVGSDTLLSAAPVDATGVDSITVTGTKYTVQDTVDFDLSGAVTQGAGTLVIEYIVDGRAAFSEG